MLLLTLSLIQAFFGNVIGPKQTELTEYSYLILDEEGNRPIEEIISAEDFNYLSDRAMNFGINSDIVWIKYDVVNTTDESLKYLYINNSSLDSLNLYVVHDGQVISEYTGGETGRL